MAIGIEQGSDLLFKRLLLDLAQPAGELQELLRGQALIEAGRFRHVSDDALGFQLLRRQGKSADTHLTCAGGKNPR
jgi:hypothetical protein